MATNDTTKKRAAGDDHPDASAGKKLRGSLDASPLLNSDPVKALIGAGKTKFYIHEHLLTSTSGFFKKALSND